MYSRKCKNFRDHEWFRKKDFTKEEIKRKNPLAMAVIQGKSKICKICGFEHGKKNKIK